MRRVQGNKHVKLIECTSPKRNKWRIRWDILPDADDYGNASYMEQEFNHKPAAEEIRTLVMQWYNDNIDRKILTGFAYEGTPVWLSSENQFNYKSAFDLALQTDGATLPVTFKLGTDDEPAYRTFNTVEELRLFYTAAVLHIQQTLAAGWKQKDAFDFTKYLVEE